MTSKIQSKKRENFDATITPRMIVKLKCTQSSNIKISVQENHDKMFVNFTDNEII
jgi:hypothetical protein